MVRSNTRTVTIGSLSMGGSHPICVQSMTNTDTRDVESTVRQIHALEKAGCQLVRVAVPDQTAAQALGVIKDRIHIPLVADIHFDHRLALMAIDEGVDKLRVNPGNFGDSDRIAEVAKKAAQHQIAIRVGVNAGSLDADLLEKHGMPCAEAMVESAMREIRLLENAGFYQTVVSLKASSISMTIAAYRQMAALVDYPLHLGITEAGTYEMGSIKSAIGIGSLLVDGIGDTIRVSLTGDPVEEVHVAKQILRALGLLHDRIHVISCPTCGRCEIDLIRWVREICAQLPETDKSMTIAIMGCGVNGPGEAKEADVGIAGGKGSALLFKKGQVIRKIPEEEIVPALLKEIKALTSDRS